MTEAAGSKPLRVLHVHQGDGGWGGGQIQMIRLREGLRELGIDSRILCRAASRPDSVRMPRSPRLERGIGWFTRRLGLNDIHCVSSFQLGGSTIFQQADVLDFHCIHHNFFSYLALPTLTREKTAVFTLHDMWPFTGHCHQSLDCERWKTGCGKCPYLSVVPAVSRDATAWEWKLKRWVYKRSNLVLVAPSRWIAERTRQSILSDFQVHHIPHGIDTGMYRPLDSAECRKALGIPSQRKVLAFMVDNLDRRLKGGDLLVEALNRLPVNLQKEMFLLLMGHKGDALRRVIEIDTLDLGYVTQDQFKAICFSAADAFVFPSRAENLPVTIIESMACGTPVISFKVGGVPELVRNGLTGFVAEPEDATQMSRHIEQLVTQPGELERMSEACRTVVETEYDLRTQARRYAELFFRVSGRFPDPEAVSSKQVSK